MSASPSSSMLGRALIAVALMIGFYLLALALVAGLLGILYLDITGGESIHPKLILVCALGAGGILWSVLPRPDRFQAPGPVLDRAQQPRLFTEIDAIARDAKQAGPDEVYLVPDINAWVAQRGGFMGFGSRRVMGLGLPLMRILTQTEFRAVLAHEFGHYHGGDTQMGPWIYKTRRAIGRTVENLGSQGSLLQLPFLWYGKMFLRVTHAVSRRQEFVADELAARLVGARALAEGLRKVHSIGPAYQAYWQTECLPILQAGYRPPLTEGFNAFVQAPPVARVISSQLVEAMKEEKADPYDTHPPLKQRLEAVAHLPAGDTPNPDPAASDLLDEVAELERGLLATLADAQTAAQLKPVSWDEVGPQVFRPQWEELAHTNAPVLAGVTPESLPALATTQLPPFAARCLTLEGKTLAGDEAVGLAKWVIGAALTTALLRRGAQVNSLPGENVSVRLGDAVIEPFVLLPHLTDGSLTDAAWQQTVDAFGIRGLDLGEPASPAHSATTR